MLSRSVEKGVEGNPPTSSINKSDAVKGLGDLLYRIHSTHTKTPTCSFESTNLQFYEHVVVATVTSKLWCFPKKYQTFIIPRFKIVNAAFSLGPRSIPKIVYFFLLIALVLIILGAVNGSCTKCKNSNSYSYYSSSRSSDNCDSAGACASLVIGCLMLIPVPILVLVPFFKKWHFVYLDVKAPASMFASFGGITSYAFRFTKVGFETSAGNQASFDEFYLIDYVYGSLSKAGNTVTSEAHLLSHFNHAALSTPIVPIHADNSVLDFVTDGVKNRKKNNAEVVEYASV
mmetsp:Transcript_2161/g.4716  ORF Transcript_2161/g.4716 Transcript_2161/m.4716 type:complete len:287 (-) Transcript_2161:219-1079(-)|eukprot:CAMPEP_0171340462 /NCGR_PEP_ID=MMETSP0878-20121228/8588_1 /TAXON_ID=67004 /ORGANISM="Thalassiosira weissflogii, Strain CCMP1336" /LENGTH=286 /DNA_ID=CAMNT_0011842533 /DNA_START=140 /DNA_END=1000 /DNA_ORIENTATION=-